MLTSILPSEALTDGIIFSGVAWVQVRSLPTLAFYFIIEEQKDDEDEERLDDIYPHLPAKQDNVTMVQRGMDNVTDTTKEPFQGWKSYNIYV